MTRSQKINSSAAVLWASAFVIAAMILVQAGRLPGQAAHAEMTATRADYTVMTTNSGRGGDGDPDELLYVIDNRDQVLLVYEVEDARRGGVILRVGWSLPFQFASARR
ncbi:MAG: hypothetical protein V3T53_04670 [Phycisphaerales bacterium]